jgi:hypothetical protein
MAALPSTIDATEAELSQLREAVSTPFQNHGNMRTKAFGQRTNAAIHRAAERFARIKALETHLAHLTRLASAPAPKPAPTADEIRGAALVRTRYGWERVVKVNRSTVTVEAEPGWKDKVSFSKILEVRAQESKATTEKD